MLVRSLDWVGRMGMEMESLGTCCVSALLTLMRSNDSCSVCMIIMPDSNERCQGNESEKGRFEDEK